MTHATRSTLCPSAFSASYVALISDQRRQHTIVDQCIVCIPDVRRSPTIIVREQDRGIRHENEQGGGELPHIEGSLRGWVGKLVWSTRSPEDLWAVFVVGDMHPVG